MLIYKYGFIPTDFAIGRKQHFVKEDEKQTR